MQLEERIEKTFENTKTEECRIKIAESFAHFVRAVGEEKPLPFESVKFKNDCFFPEADIGASGEEVDPEEEQRVFDEAEKVRASLSFLFFILYRQLVYTGYSILLFIILLINRTHGHIDHRGTSLNTSTNQRI